MTVADAPHRPVMVREVLEFLGGARTVVDMTVGAGGHAEALLEAGAAWVVGVDRDESAIELAVLRLREFGDRFSPIHAAFSEVDEASVGKVDGVLFDLGVSSMQLDQPERGFSFRVDGPLDMRMDAEDEGPTAADLVNDLSERELADLIFEYGQESKARRIAGAIVRARAKSPIRTTDALAHVVVSAVGRRPGGPHPARRTFQALRIAVNRELEELAASLPRAVDLLAPGGRFVVIAYHSLEDRIAKRAILDEPRLLRLTKKPLRPSDDEVADNPRARSARLRAAERVDGKAA